MLGGCCVWIQLQPFNALIGAGRGQPLSAKPCGMKSAAAAILGEDQPVRGCDWAFTVA